MKKIHNLRIKISILFVYKNYLKFQTVICTLKKKFKTDQLKKKKHFNLILTTIKSTVVLLEFAFIIKKKLSIIY